MIGQRGPGGSKALNDLLARKEQADAHTCLYFSLSRDDDRHALEHLADTSAVNAVHDTIEAQLADLVISRHPSEDLDDVAVHAKACAILDGQAPQDFGTWVYYPWSGRLIHVLPEREYRELRSDRNRHKITREEQAALCKKRVGITGLSVGLAAATTLALEGVGGSFRLADFDTLSLSNLNRLSSGVQNLGVNKAVLAARAILELDPYADVAVYAEGVNDRNIDAFLNGQGKLDLLVEECDDLYMKVRLRERARELGIPVIMETSDRGLLDIERFDKEPRRPLFHGVIEGLRADALRGLTVEEKVPFVMRILGGETMSTAMGASLVEIKQTLSTWPQLGSSVVLGGAIVTEAARRILLGTLVRSGRYSVDLESIVSDGADCAVSTDTPMEVDVTPEATVAPPLIALPIASAKSVVPTDAQIKYLIAHAIAAPSGGNCQPWRFSWDGRKLVCRLDETRSRSFVNYDHLASYVAIGAAVHNIALASAVVGFGAEVSKPEESDGDVVCTVAFSRQAPDNAPRGFDVIQRRCTNRRVGDSSPLTREDERALHLASNGANLQIVCDPAKLALLGEILGDADRLRFLSQVMHTDLIREVRWTGAEVSATRDGLDLATLEFTRTDLAVFRILASWPTMNRVGMLGGGRALTRASKKLMAGACAAALVTISGTSKASYFDGGRALQSVWLAATAHGLGVHPLGLPYMFARLERGVPTGYGPEEERTLRRLRQAYRTVFDVPAEDAEVIVLRLVHASPPSVRSLRRSVASVLEFL
jgi:molybdopterin/thiamine biosynthesis adenylyltransferase